MKEKGGNSFLGPGGSIHCGVRNNFNVSLDGGLHRKDGMNYEAPPIEKTVV